MKTFSKQNKYEKNIRDAVDRQNTEKLSTIQKNDCPFAPPTAYVHTDDGLFSTSTKYYSMYY